MKLANSASVVFCSVLLLAPIRTTSAEEPKSALQDAKAFLEPLVSCRVDVFLTKEALQAGKPTFKSVSYDFCEEIFGIIYIDFYDPNNKENKNARIRVRLDQIYAMEIDHTKQEKIPPKPPEKRH